MPGWNRREVIMKRFVGTLALAVLVNVSMVGAARAQTAEDETAAVGDRERAQLRDGSGAGEMKQNGKTEGTADSTRGKGRGGQGGAAFVDRDGDGICDNAGTSESRGNKGSKAGKGKSDGKGKGQGGRHKGAGFVDANSDGVCDNYGSGKGAGSSGGSGKRNGK